MKWLLVSLGAVALAGCASAPADDGAMRQGQGVALNPSGKPQTQQESAYAAEMQRAGSLMNADRVKMAQEMAAAKARTGGK